MNELLDASGWTRALTGTVALSLTLLALYGIAIALDSSYVTFVAVGMFINIGLVVGIQLFSGNSGIVSFGHAGFMGLGAYVTAIVTIPVALRRFLLPDLPKAIATLHVGLIPSLALAALAVVVVAALTGIPIMRLDRNAVSVGTFAVLVIIFIFLNSAESLTRGGQAIFGLPRDVHLEESMAGAMIIVGLARFFRESRWGLALRAARDDEVAAAANGISVFHSRLVAWLSSAALVGFAGALWAHHLTGFSPRSFYFDETFLLMAMLIIGGIASVTGAIVGTVLVTVLDQVLLNIENGNVPGLEFNPIPGLSTVALSLLILVLFRYRPSGLVGQLEIDHHLFRLVSAKRSKKPQPPEGP